MFGICCFRGWKLSIGLWGSCCRCLHRNALDLDCSLSNLFASHLLFCSPDSLLAARGRISLKGLRTRWIDNDPVLDFFSMNSMGFSIGSKLWVLLMRRNCFLPSSGLVMEFTI